ncbi:LapA family protein [Streptococcus fryi]
MVYLVVNSETFDYNKSMKKNITLILLFIVILLTATLSLANMQPVVVNYLFGSFKTPLILLILMSVALGFLIQSLISLPKHFSMRQEINHMKKELQSVNEHIHHKLEGSVSDNNSQSKE